MRILGRPKLDDCMKRHPAVRGQMLQWWRRVESAQWSSPIELKSDHPTADPLKGGRAVFNLLGGGYRVVVQIDYVTKTLEVRFAGSHSEYDRINADKV